MINLNAHINVSRYIRGAVAAAFIGVLDAQRTLQQNELSLADGQAVSTDLVALYKALGGGWA